MKRPVVVKSAPKRFAVTPVHVAIAVVVMLLAWAFWPAGVGDVANLESAGTNIIAFGDSLTAGYGAKEGEDYPSKLSSIAGVPIINAGRNGDTTESALRRLEADVLSQDPRIVLVGLGGNDVLRRVPMSTTRTNLESIVRRIQASGAMVVLLGFEFPTFGADYGGLYEEIADEQGCLLVPDVLEDILTDRTLKSDEIHPNAAGYDLMARRVSGPLEKLLAKAKAR